MHNWCVYIYICIYARYNNVHIYIYRERDIDIERDIIHVEIYGAGAVRVEGGEETAEVRLREASSSSSGGDGGGDGGGGSSSSSSACEKSSPIFGIPVTNSSRLIRPHMAI